MKYLTKHTVLSCLIASLLLLIFLTAGCGSNQQQVEEGDYHEIGMSLFKEGFYDLLPKGKTEEAMKKFALAEKAFKQAVAENPDSADDHRYLARSYSMQQKHASAAEEYIKTIEIEPDNLDNYLYLAAVYVRMKRFDDALKVLNHAKTLSKETAVIDLIDDLVQKIREKSLHQSQEATEPLK